MNNRLYQKKLMDHFRNPRNKKVIANTSFASGKNNPSCGDSISMTGIVTDGIVIDLGFEGSGCVISQAAVSMLTQKCIGMSVEMVMSLTKEDILRMIGMDLGPNRLRCALLSIETLHKGIALLIVD